mgnify:FL=1
MTTETPDPPATAEAVVPAGMSLPGGAAGAGAPDWVHLLAFGPDGRIEMNDARGPFTVADAARLIEASMTDGPLVIDEAHATNSETLGTRAPAMGWIEEMQARADGIWGRVSWTGEGRRLVEGRAYRAISPVFASHKGTKTLTRLMRAGLVNAPGMRGLTPMAAREEPMPKLTETLAEVFGLPQDASEDQLVTAARAAAAGGEEGEGLPRVAEALGLEAGAKAGEVVAAARAAGMAADKVVPALQADLKGLSAKVAAMEETRAQEAAEEFFERNLAERRAGFSQATRDDWIATHRADAARAEALAKDVPVPGAGGGGGQAAAAPPEAEPGAAGLSEDQLAVCRALGHAPQDDARTLSAQKEDA